MFGRWWNVRSDTVVVVVVAVLGSALFGGRVHAANWIDCFEDRQIFDGDPVAWVIGRCSGCQDEGRFDAATGDVILQPCGEHAANAVYLFSAEDHVGDVSLRFQGRLIGAGELWQWVHLVQCGRTYGGMLSTSPVNIEGIGLGRWDNGMPAAYFDMVPAEILQDEEYILQIDVVGEDLTLRVWRAAEGTAGTPIAKVTKRDAMYRQGPVGIGYIAREPGAYAIVRYIWVSDQPITTDGGPPCAAPIFRRGDSNADGRIDIADAVHILAYLFGDGAAPSCLDAADANDDGTVNIADATAVLDHLFAGGEPLPYPFNECGIDATTEGDALNCGSFSPCGG